MVTDLILVHVLNCDYNSLYFKKAKKMDVSAKYILNSFTESDIIISRGNHRLNCVRSVDKLMYN